jgi:meso-butanediol dehydrogenase / (S,S)-butanediol dehydrogenase / diacetyl reductase
MTAGETTIVTGAGSGIGRAVAMRLAQQGARLLLVDRDAKGVSRTADAIAGAGIPAETAVADLADEAAVAEVFAHPVLADGLSGLVNCHGITRVDDRDAAAVAADVFDQVIAVNLRSFFLTCRSALPMLEASGDGSIVNLSSAAALGAPGGPAYTASKSGILGLTRAIAREYATRGIRCNAVCPGPTDTPMFAVTRQKWGVEDYVASPQTIPRMAAADEVARVVVMLLRDATYTTGSAYAVDGGATAF